MPLPPPLQTRACVYFTCACFPFKGSFHTMHCWRLTHSQHSLTDAPKPTLCLRSTRSWRCSRAGSGRRWHCRSSPSCHSIGSTKLAAVSCCGCSALPECGSVPECPRVWLCAALPECGSVPAGCVRWGAWVMRVPSAKDWGPPVAVRAGTREKG